jgi:hypothetical protein
MPFLCHGSTERLSGAQDVVVLSNQEKVLTLMQQKNYCDGWHQNLNLISRAHKSQIPIFLAHLLTKTQQRERM